MSERIRGFILGLSDSHDAGVAVVRDGAVVAAVNEERFSRKKMASGMPVRNLQEIWRPAAHGVVALNVEVIFTVGYL